MIEFAIFLPFSFLSPNFKLLWGDILWGFDNKLIEWKEVIKFADQRLQADEYSQQELDLALAEFSADVAEILPGLALQEPSAEEDSQEKWMYLLLLWLFEHKDNREDPLTDIDWVYADFGYPERVAPLVRYMSDSLEYTPLEGTYLSIEELLIKKWEIFLGVEKQRLYEKYALPVST